MLSRKFLSQMSLPFILLIWTISSEAQPRKNFKEYDEDLIQQSNLTHSFVKRQMPAYAKDVQLGSNNRVNCVCTFYKDKNYRFSMFEADNVAQLGSLTKSSISMSGSGLTRGQFLTKEDANSFLARSAKTLKTVPSLVKFDRFGSCYIRATHVAHELYQQYPSLPVMKIWLSGPMRQESTKSSWTYHVAIAIPVIQGERVEWMVLDDLLLSSGVLSVRDWIAMTNARHTFTAKVQLAFTATDRVSPSSSLLKRTRLSRGVPINLVEALLEADAAQSPSP